MTPLWTVEEAAAYLGVKPEWLAEAARKGIVPSRKIARARKFTESDLTEYLDRVKQGQDPWTRPKTGRRKSA